MPFKPGVRVVIADTIPLAGGASGTVVPLSEVSTTRRGIPRIEGEYHPLRRDWRVIRLDSGEYTTIPVGCLRPR